MIYLDASVLVAVHSIDVLNAKADALLRHVRDPFVVSNFAAGEFASAIAKKVRTGSMTVADGHATFLDFDAWVGEKTTSVDICTADIGMAAGFVRRLDVTLRMPDAINIATAKRLGARLATLDVKMAQSAITIGINIFTV